jgi:phosphatidate cytidylyltransferase
MGAILIGLALCVLVVDQALAPWYPFLFVLVLGLSSLACLELLGFFPENRRPFVPLCLAGIAAVVASNWLPHIRALAPWVTEDPWLLLLSAFTSFVVMVFLTEMMIFRAPGDAVLRIALTVWSVAYLSIMPSFLVQLRWQNAGGDAIGSMAIPGSTVALALAIFVPKSCDIGAYFTGRLLGRHPMAPVLSPKKTWEGAAGGLVWAVVATIGINRLSPRLPSTGVEIAFGVTIGIAAMLGDLAESLIKRDCQQKDASHALPGFGGVLDVADSILFAAPLAYWWLGR